MDDKLMEKLMVAKAIMDKHDQKPRGSSLGNINIPSVDDFDVPAARYNIQEGLLDNSSAIQTKSAAAPTIDAIKNSKLPDAIKKLMMEHPIQQQSQNTGSVLSDELIEKASKLMGTKPKEQPRETSNRGASNIDMNTIKSMIEEAVNKALKENGLLVESVEKSQDLFSFRVGKHIFEGKINKVKKLK